MARPGVAPGRRAGTEVSAAASHELVEDAESLKSRVRELRAAGRQTILVPTMGDLHDGHLSLVRTAGTLGHVIVSIFVNPTQFGPGEDFDSYPRDLAADRARLATLGISHSVYAPPTSEIYDRDGKTWVTVEGLGDPLCGRHRPGHFRGVTTVVAKLFALVAPDAAVFGEKDAQQCLVIQRMVRDLRLPVRLVFVPTVREDDGLAMSSRNRYLSAAERGLATRLHAALQEARRLLVAGERRVTVVEEAMRTEMSGVEVDYAELRDLPVLTHPEEASGHVLAAVAARVGKARLIDNLSLEIRPRAVDIVPLAAEATVDAVAAAFARETSHRKGNDGGPS
jgi:pantoate--beta-alanine ligase